MRRSEHVKGQVRFFNFIGLKFDRSTVEKINRNKDLFATFPREYDHKRLPPHLHRGHEHGVLTNIKWRAKYGFPYVITSIPHNIQDRFYSRQITFIPERLSTWYPRKLIDQMCNEPILENNIIKYKRI